MSLKDIFAGKKEENAEEFYWSLIIEPGWVQAGIWKIKSGNVEIVFSGLPAAWELDEELVDKVDTALSSAVQSYPEDFKEPNECVFGVVSSWVAKGQIKDEYLSKLKKICTDLSLVPVGFVVLGEAIAHKVKLQEGSPLSACVLGVYGQSLEVSVFKLGEILGNTTVARSISLNDDFSEGIARLELKGGLPSRLLIYNGKEGELEEARQSLLKAEWDEGIEFLHTPKVEVVKPDGKIEAVSLAGASELGGLKGLEKGGVKREEQEGFEEEKGGGDLGGAREDSEKEEKTRIEDLGFVREEDIESLKEGADEGERDLLPDGVDYEKSDVVPVDIKRRGVGLRKLNFSGFFAKLGKAGAYVYGEKSFARRFGISEKKPFVFGFVFLVVFLILGFVFWWFYPKASVSVYVSPHSLREKISLKVDTSIESSDYNEKLLRGEALETSVSGEKTKSTTGTKVVGEKAKGEVTVFRVGSELVLPEGTILSGPSGLKFSTDEQVIVASGSASSPGSVKAQVTALEVGSIYNLAVGTGFSVGNYSTSDLEAKNESSFSGGTSYDVNVVAAKDQEELRRELEEELRDKADEELARMKADGDYFVEGSLVVADSKPVFNNKVGDEADSLKLNLSLEVSALVVEESQLLEFSRLVLDDKIPEGFVLRDEQIKISFESVRNKGSLYELDFVVDTNLLPMIDSDEIVDKIKGKYPELARDYLMKEVPGFVRVEFTLRPNLPGRLGTLPRISRNIELEVAADK